MTERAILFVDGNNWYHALKKSGFTSLGQLNYSKISKKLVEHRDWCATYYYVGQIQQKENTRLYASQRRYMAWMQAQDSRIEIRYGRIETRLVTNDAAVEIKKYLGDLDVRIDQDVYKDILSIANKHRTISVPVEKAVDVNIAVDMVSMAEQDLYDTAYLLSADGDFTPAVELVASKNKKIFAASIGYGAKLAASVHTFIHLKKEWFDDCFEE